MWAFCVCLFLFSFHLYVYFQHQEALLLNFQFGEKLRGDRLGRKYKLWKIRHVDVSLLPRLVCPLGGGQIGSRVLWVLCSEIRPQPRAPHRCRNEWNLTT